ncbi:hypothetical protein MKZ38_008936 [Zalerion maritima]|uniref:CUE domain-containing protein n=1 Tax=Zalerion maritima TaxID=339359 RepID=A0AAD5RH60_9PEZI|nr:hypothetical protein MKZ38_008936 [Zalerion maritima]
MASDSLPPFAPFPPIEVIRQLDPQEWRQTLASWNTLAAAYLGAEQSTPPFTRFLIDFTREAAADISVLTTPEGPALVRHCFQLSQQILSSKTPPSDLLDWSFILDLSKLYHNEEELPVFLCALLQNPEVGASLSTLKRWLIKILDAGMEGDIRAVENHLARLNNLLHASPDTAAFFLAGSDFVDGLVNCYKIINPPLRKTIIATAYLCLVGLTKGDNPKFGMLTDQLYSLKVAAEHHKNGPLNVNDSMVAELVTQSLLLKTMQQKADAAGPSKQRLTTVLKQLESFGKPGGMRRPQTASKRSKKGKGVALQDFEEVDEEMHVHRMSQITQVKDVFPDLGSSFISRMLDAFGDNTESVVASLLEDSLPDHLITADRTEELQSSLPRRRSSLVPRSTPPVLPARHNAFDDDELDRLALDASKLNFGKSNTKTADDLLVEKPASSSKAAILSALAAFDADDDERDDTYDADDVGGTIDANNDEEISTAREGIDEVLFKAHTSDPALFARDAKVRNSYGRSRLRLDTGMTDEAVEGWALMLERNPGRKKKMEAQFGLFSGAQNQLAATHWSGRNESGDSDSEASGSSFRGGRGGHRGRGGRGGRGGGTGGNVSGPGDDKKTIDARKRKEANKGQRANHNRRNQRAKKMARGGGGFPG